MNQKEYTSLYFLGKMYSWNILNNTTPLRRSMFDDDTQINELVLYKKYIYFL